jgi:hypothetical protein
VVAALTVVVEPAESLPPPQPAVATAQAETRSASFITAG